MGCAINVYVFVYFLGPRPLHFGNPRSINFVDPRGQCPCSFYLVFGFWSLDHHVLHILWLHFPQPKKRPSENCTWELGYVVFLRQIALKVSVLPCFYFFFYFFFKRCSNELTGSTQSFMCQLKSMWTTSLPRDIHIYQFDLNVTTR